MTELSPWNEFGYAVYNPNGADIETLPVIYGFNNGGSAGFYYAQLIAEDGEEMGGHICSHECFMRQDLGILVDTRPDRHAGFRIKYPGGYRMDFVSWDDVGTHPGLAAAFGKHEERYGQPENTDEIFE